MTRRRRFWLFTVLVVPAVAVAAGVFYVKSHPLVFNESLWEHAHCMPQAASALLNYADDNGGRFPFHTNGYGDALMMIAREPALFYYISGPGYDTSVFREALASGRDVDESRCGRVFVQGLTVTNDPRIAILFDKVAAPPDHCHFPRRLWAGYVREVCFIDGTWRTVPVREWANFAHQQVELLVEAGFSRTQAQQLYDQVR